MLKTIIIALAAVLLISCQHYDEQYFRSNPQALQNALKNCSQTNHAQVSCAQLEKIATEINSFAYDLQMNPQSFGIKILSLQTDLAKQQAILLKTPHQPNIEKLIHALKQELTMRLAVLKWLESPEG